MKNGIQVEFSLLAGFIVLMLIFPKRSIAGVLFSIDYSEFASKREMGSGAFLGLMI